MGIRSGLSLLEGRHGNTLRLEFILEKKHRNSIRLEFTRGEA